MKEIYLDFVKKDTSNHPFSAMLSDWFKFVPDDEWLLDPNISKKEAIEIWNYLKMTSGVKILDCPCGRADVSFYFATRGAMITGLDINPRFISQSRKKFLDAGLPCNFIHMDMRDMDYDEEFDYLINWQNSFGYFDDSTNEMVMNKFAKSLRRGGKLVISGQNIGYTYQFYDKPSDNTHTYWDPDLRRVCYRFKTEDHEFLGSAKFMTLEEYERIISNSGLNICNVFGEGFSEYIPDESEWFIIVAEK